MSVKCLLSLTLLRGRQDTRVAEHGGRGGGGERAVLRGPGSGVPRGDEGAAVGGRKDR